MNERVSEDSTAFLIRVSGKVVYGAILLEALLGALSDPLPGSLTVWISMVVSLAVVTVVGAYADWVGDDMKRRALTSWRDRLGGLMARVRERSWVLAPLLIPALFFGLATIGVLSKSDAYALTRALLLGVLFFFGFLAARLGGATMLASLVSAAMVALLGYLVVQIKVVAKAVQALGK